MGAPRVWGCDATRPRKMPLMHGNRVIYIIYIYIYIYIYIPKAILFHEQFLRSELREKC